VALWLARWLGKQGEQHLALLLALVVLLVGAAEAMKFSLLIALLAFGVLVRNLDRDHVLMPVILDASARFSSSCCSWSPARC